MKKAIAIFLTAVAVSTSCSHYNALFTTNDYQYKYEVAKQCYAAGQYSKAYSLLADILNVLKGTEHAEECLYMNGMCFYNLKDYETATQYFDRYCKTYPKGVYAENAKFYSGMASFKQSPDPRLDQTPTFNAINSLQEFVEMYPYSKRRDEVNDLIYKLQDRLVKKEYDAAKLYYDLGTYNGNSYLGGNNYEACVITAENAIKAFPYTNLKEELSFLILKAKYKLAQFSVDAKAKERFQQTIDEYYGFKNEFPDSKFIGDAEKIFKQAASKIGNNS